MAYADDLAELKITTTLLGGDTTLNRIREAVRLPSIPKILDVGCHGGYLSIVLADAFSAEVTGIDISTRVLKLAKKNIERTTCSGRVTFRRVDIMEGRGIREESFDLVIHRGLEAFVEDPPTLQRHLARAAKNWGYVVNVTHTYEKQVVTGTIDALNKAAGMHIRPTSRSELIDAYKNAGLVLIKEHSFDVPVEPAPELGNSVAEKRVLEIMRLAAENDQLTSGALLIFRKPLNLSVTDVAKG
ncbi:class I SAM-dependent methyltransferase [Modicisalibacter xianhensis]|uniref:Methyltransferase domain-containing protein n=1 Tax=Modicisalibacter xianhensis TaxID=442341 RepID=A0A1I3G3B2_9GAMM|nr:class I SAM-dependent methyltransferase [Halomonas xianhensis]SFI17651.1 Methyltransferase domain-containing protein [Halomonas xianhensis]